jgi:hypothetical protein
MLYITLFGFGRRDTYLTEPRIRGKNGSISLILNVNFLVANIGILIIESESQKV